MLGSIVVGKATKKVCKALRWNEVSQRLGSL